jgi:hypothetical protein
MPVIVIGRLALQFVSGLGAAQIVALAIKNQVPARSALSAFGKITIPAGSMALSGIAGTYASIHAGKTFDEAVDLVKKIQGKEETEPTE